MVILKPKNFNRLPLGYRPKHAMKVSRHFANKVKRVHRYGPRADDEDIANVITVVENMKTYTPSVFRNRTQKKKQYRRKKTRRN